MSEEQSNYGKTFRGTTKPVTLTTRKNEISVEEYKETKPKPSKYRNVKVVVDGITFDSKKEAKRYGELMLLVKTKEIYNLLLQEKFVIEIKDVKICTYICDFSYKVRDTGEWIIEDCKGMKTPVYNLKKKLMLAVWGIKIKEV